VSACVIRHDFVVARAASFSAREIRGRDEGRPARGEAFPELLRALAALVTITAWAGAFALVAG
jgi:hypothetical protein